eukprot:scaffold940_cov262-Pinguiococcus_pyrenoidosus.AAC.7
MDETIYAAMRINILSRNGRSAIECRTWRYFPTSNLLGFARPSYASLRRGSTRSAGYPFGRWARRPEKRGIPLALAGRVKTASAGSRLSPIAEDGQRRADARGACGARECRAWERGDTQVRALLDRAREILQSKGTAAADFFGEGLRFTGTLESPGSRVALGHRPAPLRRRAQTSRWHRALGEGGPDSSPSSTPLFQGYGTHFAYLWVGTPAQRVSVIVDTGSGITAFPCNGCNGCGSHTDPYFNADKSSSSHELQCQTQRQDCVGADGKSSAQSCSNGKYVSPVTPPRRCFTDAPRKAHETLKGRRLSIPGASSASRTQRGADGRRTRLRTWSGSEARRRRRWLLRRWPYPTPLAARRPRPACS